MRRIALIAIAMTMFMACKKEIPIEEVVTVQTYAADIRYTNNNEPKTLYYWIWEEHTDKGIVYWNSKHSDYSRPLGELKFDPDLKFPVEIYKNNGRRLNDIQVLKSIIKK